MPHDSSHAGIAEWQIEEATLRAGGLLRTGASPAAKPSLPAAAFEAIRYRIARSRRPRSQCLDLDGMRGPCR